MSERISGTVKWFSNERGFGFLLVDDDPDEKEYFVHYSYITMEGYKTLRAGQSVSFVLVDVPDRGTQAHEVQPEN
jgi:CspA family cold shock protein